MILLQTLNSPAILPQPTVPFSATTLRRSVRTKKRSNKRTRRNYAEEEYLATCLVKLARGSTCVVKRPVSPTVKNLTSHEEENIVLTTTDVSKSLQVEENTVLTRMDVKKDQEPTSLNPHTCNICNKSFSTHQALGGHKSSHRTKTQAIIVENKNLKNIKSSGKVHECSTCQKTFASGQALGGHMRKHYEGVIIVSAKNRSSVGKTHSNDVNATISTARVVNDFDLNVALTEDLYCDEAESAFM